MILILSALMPGALYQNGVMAAAYQWHIERHHDAPRMCESTKLIILCIRLFSDANAGPFGGSRTVLATAAINSPL